MSANLETLLQSSVVSLSNGWLASIRASMPFSIKKRRKNSSFLKEDISPATFKFERKRDLLSTKM